MEDEGDEGYGEYGTHRGDERQLGHEPHITAILHAEHGAEGGHRHGQHHRVDVIDHSIYAQKAEQEIKHEGQHAQPQGRHGIDKTVAQHVAQGQRGHGSAYHHERGAR